MTRYNLIIKNLALREIRSFGVVKLLSVWLVMQVIGIGFIGNLVPLPKVCASRLLDWGILLTFLVSKFLCFGCFITYNLTEEFRTLIFFSLSRAADFLIYLWFYLFILTMFDFVNHFILLIFSGNESAAASKVFFWDFFSNLIFVPSVLFFSAFTSLKNVLGSLIFLAGISVSLWSSLVNWHSAPIFVFVCLGLSTFMGYFSYQAILDDDTV